VVGGWGWQDLCLPACLPVCLSACLSACLPVCLPACLLAAQFGTARNTSSQRLPPVKKMVASAHADFASATPLPTSLQSWIEDMSSFLKSVDKNHLVGPAGRWWLGVYVLLRDVCVWVRAKGKGKDKKINC
jgi:hypothetical protein